MSDERPETVPPAGTPPASEAAAPPAPEMVEIPKDLLEALREQATMAPKYLELAKYAKADFINYQDRVRREKADWNRIALTSFVADLLPALDGFTMAKFEDPALMDAIRMLEKEFVRVLSKHGVVPIETAGKPFDPVCHDAVAFDPGGTALQELRRGWRIDGKVLRAASVKIVKP